MFPPVDAAPTRNPKIVNKSSDWFCGRKQQRADEIVMPGFIEVGPDVEHFATCRKHVKASIVKKVICSIN
jgi:hypothetical protein